METIYKNNTASEFTRIQRGQGTPQTAYYLPILQVLDENCENGIGRAKDILDEVFNKMKNILKPADKEEIQSGREVRWRKNANWARYIMVHKLGYLKIDSSPGIWEITEKGRQYLSTITKSNHTEERILGRRGNEQIKDYIIPVIKLMKSGKGHVEAFKEIANKLGVRKETVSAQCTRPFKINNLKSCPMSNLLTIIYPRYRFDATHKKAERKSKQKLGEQIELL